MSSAFLKTIRKTIWLLKALLRTTNKRQSYSLMSVWGKARKEQETGGTRIGFACLQLPLCNFIF